MNTILRGYIVFEGLDGAGTTTQSLMLHEKLKSTGIPSWLTFEPTSGDVGQLIRKFLKGDLRCHPGTLAALFAADRHEHLYGEEGIISRLDRGTKVIGDRYLFSSLAYQSMEVDFERVLELNGRFPLPEQLVYIDIDPGECERRMSGRSSRDLFENIAMQERVRGLYEKTLGLFADGGMAVHRVDGTLPQEELSEKVWSLLAIGR